MIQNDSHHVCRQSFDITFTWLKWTNETTAVLYKENLNINQILRTRNTLTCIQPSAAATPIECAFKAFVLLLSLGSWVKGVHDYKPSSNTMCLRGQEGRNTSACWGGFPEDFYSLGNSDNSLALCKTEEGNFSNARHFAKIKHLEKKMVHRATQRK